MEAKPKHLPLWSQAFPNTAESAVDARFTESGVNGQSLYGPAECDAGDHIRGGRLYQ
jgi:hypothetical protein